MNYVPRDISCQFKKMSYLSGIILGSRHFKETFVQWQIMSYGILKLKKKTIVGSMKYFKKITPSLKTKKPLYFYELEYIYK